MTRSSSGAPDRAPEPEDYGSIEDEVRVSAKLADQRAGEFSVGFEEADLLRFLRALDELDIQPDSKFFRDAAFAAIDAREAERRAATTGEVGVGASSS